MDKERGRGRERPKMIPHLGDMTKSSNEETPTESLLEGIVGEEGTSIGQSGVSKRLNLTPSSQIGANA